ncbi:MAG: outer membrane beta-barrel protein [Bacteroidia bacterium]
MHLKRTYIFLILLASFASYSQEKQMRKTYTRFVMGPALSFYKNNPYHTSDAKAKSSFYAGVFEEIRVYKDFSFVPGIEYFYQGMVFNSYYLEPNTVTLYDKHFNYNYTLTMQEPRLNLLFRQVIGIETRNIITGYVEYGYVMRYFINPKLKVVSNLNGSQMYSGDADLAFEHPFFSKKLSSGLKLTVGGQHNFFKTHRAWFFEASYMYSLSRFKIQNSFAPASLFVEGSFLQLGLGIKF